MKTADRMKDRASLRCYNHPAREAAAVCPECRRYFCRECISEHDDRMICASCLGKFSAGAAKRRPGMTWILRFCQGMIGLLLLWIFFYLLGETLVSLPSSFHEGTVWEKALGKLHD